MTNRTKIYASLGLTGLGVSVNGIHEYWEAHPSPHFYIELYWALPQVALGISTFIGSFLALSTSKVLRLTGQVLVVGSVFALGTLYFFFCLA